MPAVHHARLELTVSLAPEISGDTTVLADIWGADAPSDRSSTVLFCQPGGGMSRQYFDIRSPDGSGRYSFAEQMAAAGFTVVLIDHPGLGDAGAELDAFELTPSLLARASESAIGQVSEQLESGKACPALGPLQSIKSIGVGHSMGAMITIIRQAQFESHAGLVLLGFSTRGLPEYVPEMFSKALQADGMPDGSTLIQWARKLFDPGRVGSSSNESTEQAALFGLKHAEAEGLAGLKAARERMLPAAAMQSMLPGNVAEQAEKVRVPIFAGVGEFDMTGPPADIPGSYFSAESVELRVGSGAGHCHFVFPDRDQLFSDITNWADRLVSFQAARPNWG